MEEKIVGEKKGSSLFSDISFTLLSIASLSSVFIHTALALDLPPHSGLPTGMGRLPWKYDQLDWLMS
jgi:hypothetical protein